MKKALCLLLLATCMNGIIFSQGNRNLNITRGETTPRTAIATPADSVVVLSNENYILPLTSGNDIRTGILQLGKEVKSFAEKVSKSKNYTAVQANDLKSYEEAAAVATGIRNSYEKIIITIDKPTSGPKSHKDHLNPFEKSLVFQLQNEMPALVIVFDNPDIVEELADVPALVFASHNSEKIQKITADIISGKISPSGRLTHPIGKRFPNGAGLNSLAVKSASLPVADPSEVGIDGSILYKVDSIAIDGIDKGAYPGCEILAIRNGKIFYRKSIGYLTYDKKIPVDNNTIYDMASVTKIGATTLAAMRLYDEGKLKLDGTLGQYLPWLQRSDKADITIKDILLHQAGFEPDFPYLRIMLTDKINPNPNIFHPVRDSIYTMRVAEDMYMNKYYKDILNMQIRSDLLNEHPKYVYSDIDLQLMGYIVEAITGRPLEKYVKETFYDPMGLTSTGFLPRQRYPLNQIAPTEHEKVFRLQQLHGDVHDPRAAMWGGVQGHAGLFSNALDMGIYMEMLLNKGTFNEIQYIKPSTIELFTSYQSDISRRGLGFDKAMRPEDRAKVNYDYPAKYASGHTFGHTGYTGTCIWADPDHNFVYVLLTNRVYPDGGTNQKIYNLGIQRKIMDVFYEAMGVGEKVRDE